MIEMTETLNSEQPENVRPMFSGVAPCYAYDRRGVPIFPGDTLKIYHFTGPGKKRNYIYKFVESIDGKRLVINHLGVGLHGKYTMANSGQYQEVEVVQGYGNLPPGGFSFNDRVKLKA